MSKAVTFKNYVTDADVLPMRLSNVEEVNILTGGL